MRNDLLHFGKDGLQYTALNNVDPLAHRLKKSHITLQSGLGSYNTLMEGALGHSRRVWAIITSHRFHMMHPL